MLHVPACGAMPVKPRTAVREAKARDAEAVATIVARAPVLGKALRGRDHNTFGEQRKCIHCLPRWKLWSMDSNAHIE